MKQVHFSIDDVGKSLRWLTTNRPESIWQMRLFSKLREWHERFGLVITLYCFTNEFGFNLADIPSEYSGELHACALWLRFGYHGNSSIPFKDEANYKAGFYLFRSVIERMGAGGTNTLRMHNWLATDAQKRFFEKEGITTLLYPDDDTLPYNERDYFIQGGILYKRTRIRYENLQEINEQTLHTDRTEVCAFTHEWCFDAQIENIERSLTIFQAAGFGWLT